MRATGAVRSAGDARRQGLGRWRGADDQTVFEADADAWPRVLDAFADGLLNDGT